MYAMVLKQPGAALHMLDGELPHPRLPIFPGREIVGCIDDGSYATAGELVSQALKAVREGVRVVCASIHMSDIPSFAYRRLWEQRQLLSVANLTRQDGLDFSGQAPQMGIVTQTTRYPLIQANQALADLRAGHFEGAAVLMP